MINLFYEFFPMPAAPAIAHVVSSFHYDVAFCKTYRAYLTPSLDNLKAAVGLMRSNPDYTYSVEQVILLREYWRRHPGDRADLKRWAAEGRLTCAPGMFTMPDVNVPSGECFLRNASIGRDWLHRHLGLSPQCCWMADIFGHHPQMPQLAKTSGFTSYLFERGMPEDGATPFVWKGIDGTELPAHWEVDTYYGMTLGLAWLNNRPAEWIHDRLQAEVFEPLRRRSPVPGLMLTKLGGDFIKPEQAHLNFVNKWNRQGRTPHLRYSTPEAFFSEWQAAQVDYPLRTVRADLNPLCEGCHSMRIRIKQAHRRLEEKAAALEWLEYAASAPHGGSAALWETLSRNAFHDIICGSLVREAATEALALYARAETNTDRRMAELAGRLWGGARIRAKQPVALNSLPYAREEVVPLDDRTVALARWTGLGATVLAPARHACGRGRVFWRAKARVLENDCVRLTFGANGTIHELLDRRTGQVLTAGQVGMNMPLKQPDRGDPWNVTSAPFNGSLLRTVPHRDPLPLSGITIQREGRVAAKAADADCGDWPQVRVVRNHPLMTEVEWHYPWLRWTTRITLCAGDPLIRFRTSFLPGWKQYRLRVAFPTAIKKGRIRHSIPCGHIIRPEGEYAAQGWIDYADREKGLLLLNRGLPGNNVTDGVMLLSLFRGVSMEDAEPKPWYEEGIQQTFEYALMPFDPRDPTYAPARLAAQYNRPPTLLSLPVDIQETVPSVTLEGPAELTCLRRITSREVEVRLWESQGRAGRARLVFDRPVRVCRQTTAAGVPVRDWPVKGRQVQVRLKRFEIMTLRLMMEPA
jgi:alpha-mannosidase